MYQTNCATKVIPMTYLDRQRETERLSKITQEMAKIAFDNPEGFSDDPRFGELDRAYDATVLNLVSLR
jgi:hypothetical protein